MIFDMRTVKSSVLSYADADPPSGTSNATVLCCVLANATISPVLMSNHQAPKHCDGGYYTCFPPKHCCNQGCCMTEGSINRPTVSISPGTFSNPLFLGHWYFWLAVTATVAGILCACSLWRRHSQGGVCCRESGRDDRASEPDSNGSCYAPPQYSRCSSFYQPPPPYSEVTSKPDLYPLVISYNGDTIIKNNNSSTGYLMVQYFRNFIVRPVGSLSATSTIDSLSSSFICNATNEANTIIPPPYSCMGSLEEVTSDGNLIHPVAEIFTHNRSISGQELHPIQNSPSIYSQISNVPNPSSQSTPSHRTHSRPHSVVSIRDNPCFTHPVNTSPSPAAPPLQQPPDAALTTKLDKNQTNCDASPSSAPKVNRSGQKCKVPLNQRSQDSEDEHNFSDLLNLSVCATGAPGNPEIPSQCNPLLHFSFTNSMTGSDISSLANLGTPDSPPRATSPTMEMKELLDKIQQLPQQKSPVPPPQQPEMRQNKSYFHRAKAKTMYMPLYEGPNVNPKSGKSGKAFSKGWLSRSAPNTPCNSFVPSFPTHKRAPSGGQKGKVKTEDGSPLLKEHEESEEEDHNDENS